MGEDKKKNTGKQVPAANNLSKDTKDPVRPQPKVRLHSKLFKKRPKEEYKGSKIDWYATPKLFLSKKADGVTKVKVNNSAENIWIRDVYDTLEQVSIAALQMEEYIYKTNPSLPEAIPYKNGLNDFYERRWKVDGALFKKEKKVHNADMTRDQMEHALVACSNGLNFSGKLGELVNTAKSGWSSLNSQQQGRLKDLQSRVEALDDAGLALSNLRTDLDAIKDEVEGKDNVTKYTAIMDLETWEVTGVRPKGARYLPMTVNVQV
jgi:hypothetical protein